MEKSHSKLEVIREKLKYSSASEAARRWWSSFEGENRTKIPLILKVAEEMLARDATIEELFKTYLESETDNVKANLHYLDFRRARDSATIEPPVEARDPRSFLPTKFSSLREKVGFSGASSRGQLWWRHVEAVYQDDALKLTLLVTSMVELGIRPDALFLGAYRAATTDPLASLHYFLYIKTFKPIAPAIEGVDLPRELSSLVPALLLRFDERAMDSCLMRLARVAERRGDHDWLAIAQPLLSPSVDTLPAVEFEGSDQGADTIVFLRDASVRALRSYRGVLLSAHIDLLCGFLAPAVAGLLEKEKGGERLLRELLLALSTRIRGRWSSEELLLRLVEGFPTPTALGAEVQEIIWKLLHDLRRSKKLSGEPFERVPDLQDRLYLH